MDWKTLCDEVMERERARKCRQMRLASLPWIRFVVSTVTTTGLAWIEGIGYVTVKRRKFLLPWDESKATIECYQPIVNDSDDFAIIECNDEQIQLAKEIERKNAATPE